MLDATQLRARRVTRLQARTHHPIQDRRHEADRRVRLDASGQPVVEAPQDLLDDGFARGHLGRVAIEHLVVQRQALDGLHDP